MAADAVAEIKARLDIVDVVGSYVSLIRAGRAYKALCPFHSEKTPSFSVSQERQAWYCFGCSEGGDIFAFVQKHERTDFRSALQLLAERAGIELEERDHADRAASQRKRQVRDLNQKAQAYYVHVLWETQAGAEGRALVQKRGVDVELAKRFGLGFAPAGGRDQDALVRYFEARTVALDALIDGGLAHRSRTGSGRDRFRHRLTFPICDERGDVIAFGARALGDDTPKYLNSPETAVYHKSTALFGLHLAKDAIRAAGSVVVVEGYFDVIAAHAAGVANVVASSGTALTREQVRLMGRYASTIVLCFDNDDAGQAATVRAVDAIAAEGLSCRIVLLPTGVKDPGDLLAKSPEKLAEVIAAAKPEWQVLLDRALTGGEGGSVEDRRAASERVVALLRKIPVAATRDLYMQQAARRLELSPHALTTDVAREQKTSPQRAAVVASVPALPQKDAVTEVLVEPQSWERFIAAAVVWRPSVARLLVDDLGMASTELSHEGVRRLVDVAHELPAGSEMPMHTLSQGEQSLASRLLVSPPPEIASAGSDEELRSVLNDAVAWVREAHLGNELAAVRQELRVARDSGNEGEVVRLAARLNELAAAAPRLRRTIDKR